MERRDVLVGGIGIEEKKMEDAFVWGFGLRHGITLPGHSKNSATVLCERRPRYTAGISLRADGQPLPPSQPSSSSSHSGRVPKWVSDMLRRDSTHDKGRAAEGDAVSEPVEEAVAARVAEVYRRNHGHALPSHLSELLDGRENLDQLNARLSAVNLPVHPDLRLGILPNNGFSYAILPASSPKGRFEAHLEVCAGSADEREDQQGLAHVVEHVTYMGSRRRDDLLDGTGAQTNAFTDFHHTVYHASCPIKSSRRESVIQLALDTLHEVLDGREFEPNRLEKERAAVLSEMQMVNTIEYRTEVQLLSFLHRDNLLSKRFPIGKEEQIQRWTVADVREFHETHYRPSNVVLYLVGDFENVDEVEAMVHRKFGSIASRRGASSKNLPTVKETQSRFFPPINHQWEVEAVPLPDKENSVGASMFRHDLLQGFSVHIFAKYPIQPMMNLLDLKRWILRSVVVMALQVRFNVQARAEGSGGALFSYVEVMCTSSPREGCSVVSIDMVSDREKWDTATRAAIVEWRRIAEFGISDSELERYLTSIWVSSEQLCAQGERMSNSQQVERLMEALACSDVFMSPDQSHRALELILPTVTTHEVNDMAREMAGFVFSSSRPFTSSSLAACVPTYGGFDVPCERFETVAKVALVEKIEANLDVAVPDSLMTPEGLARVAKYEEPAFHILDDGDVQLFKLMNGISVNLLQRDREADRTNIRVSAAGGRMAESRFGIGSVILGSRTMQEGGRFPPWTRQQVELFCVDSLIQVDITANYEFLLLDFAFPTAKLESVLQLIHRILLGEFVWEPDAMLRARQTLSQTRGEIDRSLEDAAAEAIMGRLSNNDPRFLIASEEVLDALTLDDVKHAVMGHLTTEALEVSIVGDFDNLGDTRELLVRYLGSVPETKRDPGMDAHMRPEPVPLARVGGHFDFELADTDDRAVAFIAGECPGIFGYRSDGTHISLGEGEEPIRGDLSIQKERRKHPLFAHASFDLLRSVINRRLFASLRERERLTYDAKFNLAGYDRLLGGWYISEVTASPENVERALSVMEETLIALRDETRRITKDHFDAARRSLLSKLANEKEKNDFMVELIHGMQDPGVTLKGPHYLRDYVDVVSALTPDDLHFLLKTFEVSARSGAPVLTCIARTNTTGQESNDDGVIRSSAQFHKGVALSH